MRVTVMIVVVAPMLISGLSMAVSVGAVPVIRPIVGFLRGSTDRDFAMATAADIAHVMSLFVRCGGDRGRATSKFAP